MPSEMWHMLIVLEDYRNNDFNLEMRVMFRFYFINITTFHFIVALFLKYLLLSLHDDFIVILPFFLI